MNTATSFRITPFLIGLLTALFLELMPLPYWLAIVRPEWVALVLLFWVLMSPYRFGMATCWVSGFMVDVLKGDVLGLNALKYSVIGYLCLLLYQRMRMFNLLQQSFMVFLFLGLTKLMSYWWQERVGDVTDVLWFLLPSFISALMWPLAFAALTRLNRRWNIHHH